MNSTNYVEKLWRPFAVATFAALMLCAPQSAQALPQLQIGAGSEGDFSWDASTETWVTSTNPFSLVVTAKDQAWDSAGDPDGSGGGGYAYLILTATPKTIADGIDLFDVNIDEISGMSSGTSLVAHGYGTPPIEDPNSLAPHGIWESAFQVWQFQFNDPQTLIENTQPGSGGQPKAGYMEELRITLSNIDGGVEGIHMDLFTVQGDGMYNPMMNPVDEDKKLVKAFAPFSHDAEFAVPEPATWACIGLGLGLVGMRRRTIQSVS